MVASEGAVAAVVLIGVFAGLIFAAAYTYATSKVSLEPSQAGDDGMARLLNAGEEKTDLTAAMKEVKTISEAISTGANAFLFSEYKILSIFIVVFGLILLIIIGTVHSWTSAVFTVIAFVVGACTSVLCGFIGMRIAVYANARTAASALHGYGPAFVTSFKAGAVMGFALTSLGCLILYILLNIFRAKWSDFDEDQEAAKTMFEALAGYGLGGSSIALFGRVGGGIYTKAADVGADLVGKVEQDLPEDDPRNPAVIADNVGDNVGDIAGMGADLFGSFAESACAAMVVASQSDLHKYFSSMCFPLVLAAVGILMCILSSFFSTHMCVVKDQTEIEPSLKRQIYLSTIFITPAAFLVCHFFLPSEFNLSESLTGVKNWHVFICVLCGLYSGMIIGIMTEVYTSHSYKPVRAVAHACETGAATNIIYGLALGYESVIVPVFCLAITIYVSYSLAGMFGIACGALGILAPLSIDLTIDAYGPICDNAGGIAEMAHLPPGVRDITDALDAAGNTTAAIGKGFAIGSAALVSLALFGAYVTTVNLGEVDILQPFQFAGLLVGAMLPYWFSAMTMKSAPEQHCAAERVRDSGAAGRVFRLHPSLQLAPSRSRLGILRP